ncbi:MAG: SEL1-like repeat protein, partial [Thermoguttaceae bacterium]|nr:SEL1-like repeat protein [Thermoguttaceae bacterium]
KAGALKWFRAAADQGDAEAKAELEKMLAAEPDENGNDGEDGATPEELRRRAESGDADACYRLGNMYYEGNGVEENGPEAFRWHMRGAELGNAGSACSVASCYMGGDCGVEQDQAKGILWYKKAAEMGDGEAHYLLGMCYLAGYGVKKNEAEGKKWIQKAFEMGYVPDEDDSDEEEESAEVAELRRKAEEGDAEACYRLGNIYFTHGDSEEDEAAAIKWHRKGAELGYPGSQFSLGACYLIGYGLLDENPAEAANWFRKAAEQGNAEAMYYLGACYQGGIGVKKDKAEGKRWLEKSFARGYVPLEDPDEKWARSWSRWKGGIALLWAVIIGAVIWFTCFRHN